MLERDEGALGDDGLGVVEGGNRGDVLQCLVEGGNAGGAAGEVEGHQIVRGIDAPAAEGLLREVDGAVQGSGNELIELVASELEALLVQAAVDRDGCTGDV